MSQQVIESPKDQVVQKARENVTESWVLYDTVIVAPNLSTYWTYRDGYFGTFAAMGAASGIPFFNVRNRNHGLAYNNQDTRDQLPYAMHIYSIGVSFFAPSTSTFLNSNGQQRYSHDVWETELPKHTSLTLKTNQDDRLKLNCLMAPPGYGVIVSGAAQGDIETAYAEPPISKLSFTQGEPLLTNKWGFKKPLQVPRRASLSVNIGLSEYARNMLGVMPGPYPQRLLGTGAMWSNLGGAFGIQVTLGGVREVQQRGQYAA
jgi:hypothetical protein